MELCCFLILICKAAFASSVPEEGVPFGSGRAMNFTEEGNVEAATCKRDCLSGNILCLTVVSYYYLIVALSSRV